MVVRPSHSGIVLHQNIGSGEVLGGSGAGVGPHAGFGMGGWWRGDAIVQHPNVGSGERAGAGVGLAAGADISMRVGSGGLGDGGVALEHAAQVICFAVVLGFALGRVGGRKINLK